MYKKISMKIAFMAVIGVLVFGAVGCTQESTSAIRAYAALDNPTPSDNPVAPVALTNEEEIRVQGEGGNGRGRGANSQGSSEHSSTAPVAGVQGILPAVSGELNAEEAAALIFMREEEKLAHDVYVTLHEQWGLPIFQIISQSELTHTDSVKILLDRYGLNDPASSTIGVFSDPELQMLYTELVGRGRQSLAEALKVGAAIEEIDILDLQERLIQTDNADIQQVFENLLSGSENHLRAFVTNLKNQTGEVYQPQYLSAEAYQAIIATSPGNGFGRGMNGNGGRGGKP